MRYNATKKLMMQAYPRLFVDEADVLHHLFIVCGNGYEWVKGELTTGQTAEQYLAEAKRSDEDIRRMHDEWAERDKKDYEQLAELAKLAGTKIPARSVFSREISDDPAVERRKERKQRLYYAKKFKGECYFLRKDGTVGRKLYPMSKYSRILNIPDDVKMDWLNAANMALYVATMSFKPTKEDRAWLAKANTRIRKLYEKQTQELLKKQAKR